MTKQTDSDSETIFDTFITHLPNLEQQLAQRLSISMLDNGYQQQVPFGLFASAGTLSLLSFYLAPPVAALGFTLLLISLERVMKAFSTFTESFAEVSRNLMPKESASSLPSSVFTCLLLSRSDLFPTNSLTTF